MDNGTSSGGDHNFLLVLHRYATFICSLIMCVCCFVGIFGNSISLLIFTRKSMRSPINVLLAGLSLVDLFVVIFAIPVFVTPGIGVFYFLGGNVDAAIDPDYDRFYKHTAIMIVFGILQCNMIAQTCSVWTCVAICSERFVAVCYPFVAQRYSTVNRAKAVQASVFAASIAYNFVRFFEYGYDAEGGYGYRLRKNAYYFYIYYTGLYLLTHFFIPFCFITATNVLILREMRKAHSIRRVMTNRKLEKSDPNNSKQRNASTASLSNGSGPNAGLRQNDRRSQQQQTSHVIVVVTIMFTLCNTLSFVMSMWEAFNLSLFEGENSVIAFLLLDLSNLLVVFNSATTFLFYLRYCTKYRKLFLYYCWYLASRSRICRRLFSQNRAMVELSTSSQGVFPMRSFDATISSRPTTRSDLNDNHTTSLNRRQRFMSTNEENQGAKLIQYNFLRQQNMPEAFS